MNIVESISEKFRNANAAQVIANYPVAFMKLLVKEIEKRVGRVKNKSKASKVGSMVLSEPILFRNDRGKITTNLLRKRVDIRVSPRQASGSTSFATEVALEMEGMKLLVYPTREAIDITKKSVGDVIDNIINVLITIVKNGRLPTIDKQHFETIRKILSKHNLILKVNKVGSKPTDRYYEIHSAGGHSLTPSERAQVWIVMPKLIHWMNNQNLAFDSWGFSMDSDYFFLRVFIEHMPHKINRQKYAKMAAGKENIIKDIIGTKNHG